MEDATAVSDDAPRPGIERIHLRPRRASKADLHFETTLFGPQPARPKNPILLVLPLQGARVGAAPTDRIEPARIGSKEFGGVREHNEVNVRICSRGPARIAASVHMSVVLRYFGGSSSCRITSLPLRRTADVTLIVIGSIIVIGCLTGCILWLIQLFVASGKSKFVGFSTPASGANQGQASGARNRPRPFRRGRLGRALG